MRVLRVAAGLGLVSTAVACSPASDKRLTEPNPATAQDGGSQDAGTDAVLPRCTRFSEQREAYFGDLHAHTALSLDANLQGTRLRPTDAYRFAKGETVGLPPYEGSQPLRTLSIDRPLDFVALSDHAEFLGLVNTCTKPGTAGYESDACKQYREQPGVAFVPFNAQLAYAQGEATFAEPCSEQNQFCGAAAISAWNEVRAAAAAHNDASKACTFTTFVAYEWSASPGTLNLHRNVIFRNDAVPALPFSYFDGNQEEELWSALERDCIGQDSGCDALTIPHNSNLSGGLMFEPLDRAGKPIDAAYAKKRAAFEPLVEIIQHKGSSECLPEMGSDEQCNFELMPYQSLRTVTQGGPPDVRVASDFVRDALGQGLLLGERLGENPFAYGFVGGTDTHLGVPGAVDERSFPGHGGAGSSARTALPTGLVDNSWLNPGGLSVLWAEENSREALFRAMRRREAYATSGPRIVLRFFGGFGYDTGLCAAKDFVQQGYSGGVPMGGELVMGEAKGAPRFALWAMRDPGTARQASTPLATLQIVKGWVEQGRVRYAVYDVAQSDNSGAGVDPVTCEPTGQGADELCSVWEDPAFSAAQSAFYYARVLENPSCRWHSYACRKAAVDCSQPDAIPAELAGCCNGEPETHQERAWSSPIFYRAP